MDTASQNSIVARDILSYTFLSRPRFAPGDGSDRVAFRAHAALYDDNRYRSDLWLLYPGDSPELLQLTAGGRVGAYVWEDDEQLLFASDRNAEDQKKREEGEEFTQFYRISVSGGEAVPAFRTEFSVSELQVLPGGRMLLKGTLRHVSEEERKARKDASVTIINEIPMWSNGGGFVSDTRAALFLRDADGGITRVTPEGLAVDDFVVSPDGETLLFTGYAFTGKRPARNDLFRYRLSEGKSLRLSDDTPKSYDRPVFTGPTSAVIAVNAMGRYGLNENPDFLGIDLEQDRLTPITDGLDRSIGSSVGSDCRFAAGSPARFADGWLYFVTTEGTRSGLRRLDPADGRVEDAYLPDGSLDAFDVRDGRALIVELRPDALQELYLVNLEGAPSGAAGAGKTAAGAGTKAAGVTPLRQSSFNIENLVSRKLSLPEPLSVTRDDGTVIEGFVIAPPHAEAGKKRPGILAIHGGPKTVYGAVFNHEMQTLAHAGYYVFFCNPRGSDGRGNAFADIRGKYGTVDYEDLMAFTDAVLEAYSDRIDRDRLGVMGGSYGGFMTNWIVGSSNRFAAAVSQRSISSWLSMWGTSDIGFYFTEDQIAGDPWEGREALWRQSPLRLARQVRTPLLLIHSRQDYRCWEVEAFQFFTAIRYHGGEARLALFDGETHELSRSGKPKPRIRRLEEILSWFDEHLG